MPRPGESRSSEARVESASPPCVTTARPGSPRCLAVACLRPVRARKARFPLRPSTDGRVLVDASGRPFPILGRPRGSWRCCRRPTWTSCSTNGRARLQRRGAGPDRPRPARPPRAVRRPRRRAVPAPRRPAVAGRAEVRQRGGEAPDFTTPNEAYWRGIDACSRTSKRAGCWRSSSPPTSATPATPTRAGWGDGRQRTGGCASTASSSPGATPATTWCGCSAATSASSTRPGRRGAGLIDGLMRAPAGAPKLRSAEWSSETIGTDQPEFGPLITLNGAYTFDGYAADHPPRLRGDAGAAGVPAGGAVRRGSGRRHQRQPPRDAAGARFQWWGWLGSIGGYVAGNGYVWPFAGDTWRAHLDTRGLPRPRAPERLHPRSRGTRWCRPGSTGCAS